MLVVITYFHPHVVISYGILRSWLTRLERCRLDALDVAAMKAMIASQLALIEHLKLVIPKLRRMQFGRRSEKACRRIEQLELQLEDLEAGCAGHAQLPASEPALKPAPPAPRKSRTLPEQLRREVHTHLPEHESCPECGGTLKKLCEDISEMLEYIPASFVVLRHVRPKLSCARCSRVVQAPAPTRPVDRGLAGPGLLAHVLTAKFATSRPRNLRIRLEY